jgi:hypothetical protein
MLWSLLILSLPTENASARMRAWRALKSQGAAVLRDGVYLLPAQDGEPAALREVVADVRDSGGHAWLLATGSDDDRDGDGFSALFDRSAEFGELMAAIAQVRTQPPAATAPELLKQARKLRKAFTQLVAIDFFPGEAQRQASAALLELDALAARLQSPHEPLAVAGALTPLSLADHQGRRWATRTRPWVDRLACAWLIRRFIDPQAQLLWLDDPAHCPPDALGFDFDGATFSHVGARVTCEVLMQRFGLQSAALQRLGALVHYLDVGGVQPAEASGIERLLAGLHGAITDDDQLLASASTVFDGLLAAFEKDLA